MATVLLAKFRPFSLSFCVIKLSDKGFLLSSFTIRSFIKFLITIDDVNSSLLFVIFEEKKNFNSNIPWGVDIYFSAVARDMVAS